MANRSATCTKTDTAVLETPQSVTVIGAEQIETLKAQNVTDVIAYSVGGARAPYGERTGDEVLLRGFLIPTSFRDGTRYQGNRFEGQQETYGLERIEVLKGAASILYGAAEPGGVVNTVSKRPTTDPLREIAVEFGSFQRKQVAADFAGALSEDGVWSYRLTGVKRDSETYIDYIDDDRDYIAPALTWRRNRDTSITLLTEYQRDRTAYGGDGQVYRALAAGAAGYILKSTLCGGVADLIRSAHAGRNIHGAELTRQLALRKSDQLTGREHDVLSAVARGHSNKEVARQLGIADETVKGYLSNVMQKLQANDRTHAMVIAIRRGMLD